MLFATKRYWAKRRAMRVLSDAARDAVRKDNFRVANELHGAMEALRAK